MVCNSFYLSFCNKLTRKAVIEMRTMLSWLILSLCLSLLDGAPSTTKDCLQIAVNEVVSGRNYQTSLQAVDGHNLPANVTVKLFQYEATSMRPLCVGAVNNMEFKLSVCDKDSLCLYFGDHTLPVEFGRLLRTGLPQTVKYSCTDGSGPHCIEIKSISYSHPVHITKRDFSSSVAKGNQPQQSIKTVLPSWAVAVIAISCGVLLLSFAVALCVKDTTNEVNLTQTTGLRIIDGPPREYVDSKARGSNSIKVTEHHNEANNITTQEARVKIEQPSSPDSLSSEKRDSTSSPGILEPPKLKNMKDPLPPTPQAAPNQDEDKEEEQDEENPYDLAETDRNGASGGNDNPVNQIRPPLPPIGSYAKVSRHPDNGGSVGKPVSSYAEVGEMRHTHSGRIRSSTEPIEPPPPLPPINKPRTLSGGDSGHIPLPPPLSSLEAIRNSVHSPLTEEEKVYDSLDDERDEMYESVPEDLKEELVGMNPSLPISVPPRSPKGVDSLSGSPSPTKLPSSLGSPDSPTFKKQSKKIKKKTRSESSAVEEDVHRPKMFLNRFRSSSASVTAGKKSKEGKRGETSLSSPDHLTPQFPPPTIPQFSESFNEDDEDDGMYDSVDPAQILDIKAKTASLPPPGNRSSHLFNPRVAEPLPEVPEDSGSNSKGAVMVMRERVTEQDDPNYDIVLGAAHGLQKANPQENEEYEEEDHYDTVQPRANPQDLTQSLPSHSYAKVTSHNSQSTCAPVNHDDRGYAVVDPDIVMRKRAASMGKQGSQSSIKLEGTSGESPYDKVKKEDDINEPPYDRVKKDDEIDEPPYDSVKKDDEIDEPPYDRVKKDDEIDEPPYDSVKKDDEIDEPPYDRVKKDYEIDRPPFNEVHENGCTDEAHCEGMEQNSDIVNGNDEEEQTQVSTKLDKPGYATVTGTKDADPDSPDRSGDNDHPSTPLFSFTTETVEVQDETYSLVNLDKKHEQRRKNKEQQNGEASDISLHVPGPSSPGSGDESCSSTPPLLPPVGDLGDMSEFIPPPVPSPLVDLSESISPNENLSQSEEDSNDTDPNCDVVEPVKSTALPTQNGTVTEPMNGPEIHSSADTDPKEDVKQLGNTELLQPASLPPETETPNIYDSLEPQQVTYDSLAPKVGSGTYDSLEKVVQNQS